MFKKYIYFIVIIIKLFFAGQVYADEQKICFPLKINGKLEPIVINMRVYDNVVSFNWNLKETFCHAYQEQNGPVFLVEYIPQKQTLDNWQDMFTLLAANEKNISSEEVIKNFSVMSQAVCKTYNYSVLKTSADSIEIVTVCGSHNHAKLTKGKDVSEVTHYYIKNAGNTSYQFFHSKKGKPLDASKYDFNNADIKKWSTFLHQVQLLPATD